MRAIIQTQNCYGYRALCEMPLLLFTRRKNLFLSLPFKPQTVPEVFRSTLAKLIKQKKFVKSQILFIDSIKGESLSMEITDLSRLHISNENLLIRQLILFIDR